MDRDSSGRPAVLDTASETQIQELERQFDEQDRQAWKTLTKSYGWSDKESQAVWDWFSIKPGTQLGIESQPHAGDETF